MCTRILWNSGEPVVVARTMDWPDTTMPVITAFPSGMARNGGEVAGETLDTENPLLWTSRFGSIVTTMYGIGTADGINEQGLSAHMLYLEGADFGERDTSRSGLVAGLWVQYLLDMASTVTEAIQLMQNVQLLMIEAHGHESTVHLAIEDASGDSAIIEHLNGERKIHHDRNHIILTNEPSYEEQIRLLAQKDFSNPSDNLPIDGNVNPIARFQRAAYFSKVLPHPADERQAIAGVLAIARNVSIPFGAPYEGFGMYNTEYRTVSDLTNKRYFFELSTAPNVFWLSLENVDFTPGASTSMLNPDSIELSGDVSHLLQPGEAPF